MIDQINSAIFSPCPGLSLRHNVKFGSKDKNKMRKSEFYESSYTSNKYVNTNNLKSLNINIKSYLVLEPSDFEEQKVVQIYMSYPHIPLFIDFLKDVYKWNDIDDLYETVKTEDGETLDINSKYKRLEEISEEFINGRKIKAKPTVIEEEDMYDIGADLYLTNNLIYTITYNEIHVLIDFLSTFNLYTSSQLLLNIACSSFIDDISIDTNKGKKEPRKQIPRSKKNGDNNED